MFADIYVRGWSRPQGTRLTNILITNSSETDENWDPSMLGQLATIRVVFTQLRKIEECTSRTWYFNGTLPAENLLDEKSKKAGTHGAR